MRLMGRDVSWEVIRDSMPTNVNALDTRELCPYDAPHSNVMQSWLSQLKSYWLETDLSRGTFKCAFIVSGQGRNHLKKAKYGRFCLVDGKLGWFRHRGVGLGSGHCGERGGERESWRRHQDKVWGGDRLWPLRCRYSRHLVSTQLRCPAPPTCFRSP